VFGFTDSTPSVSSEMRSMSWLPYEGPVAITCMTSSGSTSRRRSSPVNGSAGPCRLRTGSRTAAWASASFVVSATARLVAPRGLR
jgi:hypothetical protein